MTYVDEYQENIRLDSVSNVEESYRMLCSNIAEREEVAEDLTKPLSADKKGHKLRELEQLCEKSRDHPFIVDLKHKKFTKTGFRYFAMAFYAHIPPIVDCIKRSGIPGDVSKHFSLHIDCDEYHYSDLKTTFTQFINARQDIIEAEAGLRIMLGIRGKFFEHLKSKNLLE